jgi:hypothetical protein
MATSPNYGWSEPDNTSLVKDGAQAMRTLGDAIDTSLWNVGYGQAGKNKIINGDFGIWQRGTTFTSLAAGAYCADRFAEAHNGTGTVTVTQQTFTPGTAPVAGYEGNYFLRDTLDTVGTSTFISITQAIENVRTFAGQTVTLSFWAKADSARTSIVYFAQQFGSGGSGTVFSSTPSITYSTSWQRFTFTIAIPSIAGKTIGAGSSLLLGIRSTATAGSVLDLWGVQVEYGSKATPFQTASGGSIQGELAMCQRYYAVIAEGTSKILCNASAFSATVVQGHVGFPVTMRTTPTLDATSGTDYYQFETTSLDNFNSLTIYRPSQNGSGLINNSNFSGTTGVGGLITLNNASSKVAFSAEL